MVGDIFNLKISITDISVYIIQNMAAVMGTGTGMGIATHLSSHRQTV
jgi:hypothetical protein